MSRTLTIALVALSSATALALPPEPGDPPPTSTTREVCTDLIDAKLRELSARGTNLGTATSPVRTPSASFCWQSFQRGRIHTGTLPSSKTIVITGSVLSKYSTLGYEAGFGQALDDVTKIDDVRTVRFTMGSIVTHPTFGTRAIQREQAARWRDNLDELRFGYPTFDQLPNPFGFGAYSLLERGYAARTDDMGSWIDFTGTGEGRVTAAVDLYADAGLRGTTLARGLSSESPVALRPQLGALDNLVSSLSVVTPTRASLYLYDSSPLDGRYMRITGADNSIIKVTNLGTFMNDRPSSMVLVNHGTASALQTVAALTLSVKGALDHLRTQDLLASALGGYGATGSLAWNNDTVVTLIPGQRLVQFTRSAYLDVNVGCFLLFNCNADGNIQITISVRPIVTMVPDESRPTVAGAVRPSVHVQLVEATAVSGPCAGTDEACAARAEGLGTLFDSRSVTDMVTSAFDASFDAGTRSLWGLPACVGGIPPEPVGTTAPPKYVGGGVLRVNVLPDALELVTSDSPVPASCSTAGVETTRPRAAVTYGDTNGGVVPPFDGTVTVAPYVPPVVH